MDSVTKDETMKVVKIITATYPNMYKGITSDVLQNMISIWHEILKEYDYNLVQMALKSYIANDTKGFPPTPGQIVGHLRNLIKVSQNDETMNGIEAWGLVSKALRNSLYNAEEQFNKLPALVQKAVGSPMILKEWASLGVDEVQTVTHSNFLRTYGAVVKREEELDCIPTDVKNAIGYKKMQQMCIDVCNEVPRIESEKQVLACDTSETIMNLKKELGV